MKLLPTPLSLSLALASPIVLALLWHLQLSPVGPVQNGVAVAPWQYTATIAVGVVLGHLLAACASRPFRLRRLRLDMEAEAAQSGH